jgi:hypothetical protein
VRSEFRAIAFEDPASAAQRLDAVLAPECDGLAAHLADALSEACDPGAVLVRIERLLDAVPFLNGIAAT